MKLMKKSWNWLLYLDLILPLLLFLAALITKSTAIGSALARIFHSYNLYVISPIPTLKNLAGIAGLIIHGYALVSTVIHKDLLDFLICAIIAFITIFIFASGFNYDALKLLSF